MNWIDFLAIGILSYFIWRGYKIGLIASVFNLLSAILSVIIAIRFYPLLGGLFTSLGANQFISPVLGFFALLLLSEFLLSFLLSLVYNGIQVFFAFLKPLYWLDKGLGIIPQFLMGVLLITVTMIVLLRLPLSIGIKNAVLGSYWGREFVPQVVVFEPYIRQVLGTLPQDTLSYLIPKQPDSGDTVQLSFPDNITMRPDPEDEESMFLLVNKERRSRGIRELQWDATIVPVARKHSTDMFVRSYFSHNNPDGQTPFDRMTAGGINYILAGENLAYAPSVEIAHKGLMNSPGHRDNILRKEFGRVGIGAIDGGIYGKMYTQNFAE